MSTTTAPDRAKPIRAADVTDAEIASLRANLGGRKLRIGYKQVIETGDPVATEYKIYACPTIEVWHRPRRQYLPLAFNAGWHFTDEAERNSVLRRLTDDTK